MNSLTPARVTMLMFLVIGGLVAAYVAKTLFAVDEKPPAPPTTRNIPLPISDLAPGTIITSAHLGSARVNVDDIDPATLMHERVIVGRMVKEKLPAARPIASKSLYPPNQFAPLEVADGMRAVAVDLSPTSSLVDGMITPGQYVDVHMTVTDLRNRQSAQNDQLRGGLTLTLFKGVRVVAINRMIVVPQIESARNAVTLELSPTQANVMILARERGEIVLSYTPDGQGGGGIDVASADRTTFDEILGLDPLPTPIPPFRAEIYRGGRSREEVEFNGRLRVGTQYDNAPQLQPQPNGANGPLPQNQDPNAAPPAGNTAPYNAAPPANPPAAADEPTVDDLSAAPSV